MSNYIKSLDKWKPKTFLTINLFSVIGIFFILLGIIYSDYKSFPFPWALMPVIGTAFLISSFINEMEIKSVFQKFFETKIITYIGKISYSLYLWHWLVFSLFRWTVGFESVLKILLATFLSLVISMFSYHYIELPFRKNLMLQNKSNASVIIFGLAFLVFSFFIAKIMFYYNSNISLSVTKNKDIWYPYPNNNYDKNISDDEKVLDKKIFVIGDSHAGAYSTMLHRLSKEYGYKYIILSSGGCPLADLLRPGYSKSQFCQNFLNNQLLEIENQSNPGDIIFLASLRMNRLSDQWISFNIEDVLKSQESMDSITNRKKALEETFILIERFQKKGLNIIIDAPKPVFSAPLFRCSDWFNKTNDICKNDFFVTKEFLEKFRKPVLNSLSEIKEKYPEVVIWDPFPILCPKDKCFAYDLKGPLFFDGDHLSGHGNEILYPNFLEIIKNIK